MGIEKLSEKRQGGGRVITVNGTRVEMHGDDAILEAETMCALHVMMEIGKEAARKRILEDVDFTLNFAESEKIKGGAGVDL